MDQHCSLSYAYLTRCYAATRSRTEDTFINIIYVPLEMLFTMEGESRVSLPLPVVKLFAWNLAKNVFIIHFIPRMISDAGGRWSLMLCFIFIRCCCACERCKGFVILLSIFALTPVPIRARSRVYPRSLPHVLMHEYLRENDKSQVQCCYSPLRLDHYQVFLVCTFLKFLLAMKGKNKIPSGSVSSRNLSIHDSTAAVLHH